MKKIYYNSTDVGACLDDCPYKEKKPDGVIRKVGSVSCTHYCPYKTSQYDNTLKFVYCNHPSTKTNRNNANKG